MLRIFYYLAVWPTLLLLRILFWPVKLLLRILSWCLSRFSGSWAFWHADLGRMDGWEFEEYAARLLEKNGFRHVQVTRSSGDQGVDILAERDGTSYAIQCKHYTGKISNKAVQEAYAGAEYYGCDVPVVLTDSSFTRSARELGESIGVELWDGEALSLLQHRSF
ncbi:MAG: restriction endonuclease [Lachnospiraceae bacterium]|jgi:HJR/Mrr/RecB family endonuclease|nr:restriction endonuclease [Lachnospiraceae bacterium]MCI9134392.1 restriction endonuclease [Lachnospiraceae bacterium]